MDAQGEGMAHAGAFQHLFLTGEGDTEAIRPSLTAGQAQADGPQPLLTQLVERIHVAIQEGRHEVRILLTPESLGTIHVEISAHEREVKARLLVDNPLVKEVIEGNLHRLKEDLLAHGLHAQDIAVLVGQHFTQQESTPGHVPFPRAYGKAPQDHTPGGLAGDIPGTPAGAGSTTDSTMVDLFV